jgi:hypothetical protein
MMFHLEYKNPKDKLLDNGIGIIHLVSKNIKDVTKELWDIVTHTLEVNSIYEWSLVAKRDEVTYE